jgi:hypothetical protein
VSKVWIIVLATLPFQVFIIWAVCWLVLDALRDRRTARTAATEVHISARKPRQSTHEPNTATAQANPGNCPQRSESNEENNPWITSAVTSTPAWIANAP